MEATGRASFRMAGIFNSRGDGAEATEAHRRNVWTAGNKIHKNPPCGGFATEAPTAISRSRSHQPSGI